MKYFFDTEFIEGFHKPFLGKRRHFIDLISIGIVAEDGREYSAVSKEYNYNDASEWVKENVILPAYTHTVHGMGREHCSEKNFHKFYGKSNAQIAKDIVRFVNPIEGPEFGPLPINEEYKKLHSTKSFGDGFVGFYEMAQPDFYAYYADYDWVLLCSLFGTMMQLPEGFPMYCIDLKQMIDESAKSLFKSEYSVPPLQSVEHALNSIKSRDKYPKQTSEHVAIADARWNFELYKFLMENQ